MSWFKRKKKPKFEHPCPLCRRYGAVYPHGGQHVVCAPKLKPGPPPPPPVV